MEQELETFCIHMRDAGCKNEELEKAQQLYNAGEVDALILFLRICRCSRLEELHEKQRKLDRLDYLIRQAQKQKATQKT